MNFESGTKLAKFQDSLIKEIKSHPFNSTFYDKETLYRLSSNAWVKWAEELAPNNLVVRQWCLEDIVRGVPKNASKINSMCYELAPFPGFLWCEGYSYWRYTVEALELYIEYFDKENCFEKIKSIKRAKDNIEEAFIRSSYIGEDELLYPAPFGDLREVPLVHESQNKAINQSSIFIGKFLEKAKGEIYYMKPFYKGMNSHTPLKKRIIQIVDGKPKGFKFYTGYDNKYDSRREEAIDLAKRFFRSLFR